MYLTWSGLLVVAVATLMVLEESCTGQKTDRVIQLGNPLKASISGIDNLPEPGVIFLMHDVILLKGILFAFSVFFRSDAPVRLQIWRPLSPSTLRNATIQPFTLLFEVRVIPSVVNLREDIYIESKITKKCIQVQQGDRLGVHLEKSPSAVAYAFDSNNPEALGHTYKKADKPIGLQQTVEFDLLRFPYDFSLAAYIDTDLSRYDSTLTEQPCPAGLLIPDHLKPVLPTLMAPTPPWRNIIVGATGEQGVPGIPGAEGRPGPNGFPGTFGKPGVPGAQGPGGGNGLQGPAGSRGSEGYPGVKGLPGVKGPLGEPGDRGPAGPRGPLLRDPNDPNSIDPEAAAALNDNPNRLKVIIATVWLIIVSVIIIIVVIVLILIKRRDRYAYRERLPSAGSDFKPSWMDVLGDEEAESFKAPPKTPQVIPDNLPTYAFDNDAMSYGSNR